MKQPFAKQSVAIFWVRRDLRLHDNNGLLKALQSGLPVIPLFIFDTNILNDLQDVDDSRVTFIHRRLQYLQKKLREVGSDILVKYGSPMDVWKDLLSEIQVKEVYFNRDYEPYARERDAKIRQLCVDNDISVHDFKDQVIFEQDEVVKDDGDPYTVYTPYMRKWHQMLSDDDMQDHPSEKHLDALYTFSAGLPSLEEIGFRESSIRVRDYDLNDAVIGAYSEQRDFPASDATTHLSVHLRFGTVGIRTVTRRIHAKSERLTNELIWREFLMQILYHFPQVVHSNFRSKYDSVQWRNNETEFERWKTGHTGFPFVDAGMRQLNTTGFMHNRARMVVASFLCKDLLIDWRWGEAYFARRLLDYELSSNNGNWQWAAGTGCDAAPYFRVFNPHVQLEKFDPDKKYVKKWVKEFGTEAYPAPLVDHLEARKRALDVYKAALDA